MALTFASAVHAQGVEPAVRSPDQIWGDLFVDVQRARVFPDQKTFPDCVPRAEPDVILRAYAAARQAEAPLDLEAFVRTHFLVPEVRSLRVEPAASVEAHLHALWDDLTRAPDRAVPGASLLPLPHPYVVPGGRFREVYYWDSYFTMLGLRASGKGELIRSMVDNFAYQLETYGLIPNGNRTYYLSRSQPPFFALMVELLAATEGEAAYLRYRAALEAEHAYWSDQSQPTRHVVELRSGIRLNRYFDQRDVPRPESFAIDEAVAARSTQEPGTIYRHLRSAAESGWDFSSRWLADGRSLETIETTDVVPVDLNALLVQLERTLAKAGRAAGDDAAAERWAAAATARAAAIRNVCWSEEAGYFFDYDLPTGRVRDAVTLAGVVPLFLEIATAEQAAGVARVIEQRFLRPGGVVTTLVATGEQWDAPNGWAPLQWMTIQGLRHYGHEALAATIAERWLRLNRDVYARTGRMMEKYNVEDPSLTAGGGEYPSQDGFGWTNGVWLALHRMYPDAVPQLSRESATDK